MNEVSAGQAERIRRLAHYLGRLKNLSELEAAMPSREDQTEAAVVSIEVALALFRSQGLSRVDALQRVIEIELAAWQNSGEADCTLKMCGADYPDMSDRFEATDGEDELLAIIDQATRRLTRTSKPTYAISYAMTGVFDVAVELFPEPNRC